MSIGAVEWSRLAENRTRARQLLPRNIFKIPVIRSHRAKFVEYLSPNSRLLDIGAGDRNLFDYLTQTGLEIRYSSMDIDRARQHDFYSLADISDEFDAITLFEVIEHMSVDQAYELMSRALDLLVPGGHIFISTPNPFHATRFRVDCSHTTPFTHQEIAGLLLGTGFAHVEAFRVANLNVKKRIVSLIYRPLLSLLEIDFAKGLLLVGLKPASG